MIVMRKFYRVLFLVSACVVMGSLVGCFGGLSPVSVPQIDADAAAERAISTYDKNGDGMLSGDELSDSPPLLIALKSFDGNKDQNIDKDELVQRFSMWANSGIGVSSLVCRVTIKGQPLAGAQVELVPEEFFGNVVQPAIGTTGKTGNAVLAIDSAHLPEDMQNFRGVHQGLYRVKITHPDADLPSKFNSATTLGLVISFETGRNFVKFEL